MNESEFVPAFVLHTRPYRETSQLVDLFVATAGKVSVVARGSRTSRSTIKGLLQPFIPLNIRYTGKSALKSLQHIESQSIQISLSGERLFSAMYLNELLYYLLEHDTEYPGLYGLYFQSLLRLSDVSIPEAVTLREFEFVLLQQLGYGADFEFVADTGLPVEVGAYYRYDPENGFLMSSILNSSVFSGAEIIGISRQQFHDPQIAAAARRFCRQAFAALLGNRRLRSRELYSAFIARRSE